VARICLLGDLPLYVRDAVHQAQSGASVLCRSAMRRNPLKWICGRSFTNAFHHIEVEEKLEALKEARKHPLIWRIIIAQRQIQLDRAPRATLQAGYRSVRERASKQGCKYRH
jgi:hypothetical protein